MGNSNSGIVCCAGPPDGLVNIKEDEPFKKTYERPATAKTSVSSSKKGVRAGYSFSSISSKSSRNSDEDQENNYPPPEMRNDAAEWCHSLSDEIRVSGSSYDEAKTEALNDYYSEPR